MIIDPSAWFSISHSCLYAWGADRPQLGGLVAVKDQPNVICLTFECQKVAEVLDCSQYKEEMKYLEEVHKEGPLILCGFYTTVLDITKFTVSSNQSLFLLTVEFGEPEITTPKVAFKAFEWKGSWQGPVDFSTTNGNLTSQICLKQISECRTLPIVSRSLKEFTHSELLRKTMPYSPGGVMVDQAVAPLVMKETLFFEQDHMAT